MPTYEYECTKCAHTFEVFQNITDARLEKCPNCGQKVKRLIGKGSGIIFKGAGFYATDYRKSGSSDKSAPACPKSKEGCDGCQHSK